MDKKEKKDKFSSEKKPRELNELKKASKAPGPKR